MRLQKKPARSSANAQSAAASPTSAAPALVQRLAATPGYEAQRALVSPEGAVQLKGGDPANAGPSAAATPATMTTAAAGASEAAQTPPEAEAGAAVGGPYVELTEGMRREVEDNFPNLNETNWACLEWKDNGAYNCFAHSVGLNNKVIGDLDVNPMGSPLIEHWDQFYAKYGYGKPTPGGDPGADVLLYGSGEDASHGAVKSGHSLAAGATFESKLGAKQLIIHTLDGLEGGRYGEVIRSYYKL